MLLTTIGALWAGLTGLCNFGLLMVSLEVLFDPLVVGIMLFVFLPGAALLFIGIILLKETSQKGPD
ncbi:MAG: hypothetical protein CME88_14470 [Hirschia sp.]|nr:hypothetical protein [Hirschia sp.]MBF19578.1 hypothetical protein [Hirschia sp.]